MISPAVWIAPMVAIIASRRNREEFEARMRAKKTEAPVPEDGTAFENLARAVNVVKLVEHDERRLVICKTCGAFNSIAPTIRDPHCGKCKNQLGTGK